MTEADQTGPVTSLTEHHFPAFFEEVHGWAPFPWQRALLHRVLEHGWPELIDVPTGLGKTAILDVAVFASALRCEHARRRIFLVVDRRLIVDQAHEHAARIQQSLGDAEPGTLCHAVARRLAAEGDDGPVLDITRMRGGVSWSWLWLERPDRHAIVTGTVDQVGSRLLFRGYGVGERLRPVDAALAGTDSLIIVDEAHLSDAFLATLRDIRQLEPAASTSPASLVVAMSASPGEDTTDTHRIGRADEKDPVAGQRLTAPKRLHLVAVPATKNAAASATADTLASLARQVGGTGRVTGVVANTVAMARAVFGRLQAQSASRAGSDEASCVLLTGRIRPVDREYLLHAWYPRIRAGAIRDDERELYVVATQTIEVGADIDLDTLVTESASLPALIQRLGRVNRRGEHPGAIAVVVHCDDLHDSVYGAARQQTWQWLTSLADPVQHRGGRSPDLGRSIDASPAALRHCVARIPIPQRQDMYGPKPYAPLVSAVTLDTWARTSPIPHPDVPVAPYLHGIGTGEPTVSVVWRADVHGDDPEQWRRSTDRLPPSADEAIELPVSAVRRWLARPPARTGTGERQGGEATREAQAAEAALSDTESQAAPDPDEEGPASGAVRRVLRYRAASDSEAVTPRQVQPGDLLIVSARWGGCDRYGWNPGSADPVTDVADLTAGRRRAAAVRVGPVLISAVNAVAPGLTEPVEQLVAQIRADIGDDAADITAYRIMLGRALPASAASGDADSLPHERVLRRLASSARLTVLNGGTASDEVIALLTAAGSAWNDDASAAGSSASGNARPMTLAAHQAAVRDRAGQFARNLGLPDPVIRAVMLAAARHDEGKRDPRFQMMLHGGDRFQAMAAGAPLAKSGMDPADRTAFRLAQQRSGYPSAMRHEALSARVAALLLAHGASQAVPGAIDRDAAGPAGVGTDGSLAAGSRTHAVDRDLVIHLVASHHGYGRPLLPAVADPAPVTVEVTLDGAATQSLNSADTVDWNSPGRFARLCKDYGRWGLPLLEAIVRLADIWCSARSEESA